MGSNNRRNRSSTDRRAGSSENTWTGYPAPLRLPNKSKDVCYDNCYDAQAVQQQQCTDYEMTCIPDYEPIETIPYLREMNLHTITQVPIHQLLSKRNFQISRASRDMREVLEDCPGIDYASLKQALHLASCFIEVSTRFWHTVLQGKVRQVLNARTRSYEFVDDDSKYVYGEAKKETTERLRGLASYVKFEVGQDPEAGSCTLPGEDIRGAGNDFKHGKQSTIYLSQQKVHAVMAAARPGADPLKKAAAYFEIARDIVHELTHAAIFAARGTYWRPRDGEKSWSQAKFFFKGSPVAEEVYELEHRLLGGRIEFVLEQTEKPAYYVVNGQVSTFHHKVVSLDRPRQHIRCVYDDLAAKAGLRGEQAAVFQAWYVRMAHICELFQADFWYKVGANNDQIPWLRSVYPVEYRYPSTPANSYAPLDSPRLAAEAGWIEADSQSRSAMQLCDFSGNGLPRGCSAVWRVLEQRQEVYGQEGDEIMDIDGGFVYLGHGEPNIVRSEVWLPRGQQQ